MRQDARTAPRAAVEDEDVLGVGGLALLVEGVLGCLELVGGGRVADPQADGDRLTAET